MVGCVHHSPDLAARNRRGSIVHDPEMVITILHPVPAFRPALAMIISAVGVALGFALESAVRQ
jgi:hypothetical protein